jgi:hypothetical protein
VTVWTSTSLALLPAPKRAALGAVRGANGGDAVMIAEVWVHGGTVALSKLPLTSRFCQVGVHGASIGVASIGRASIGGGASIGRASTAPRRRSARRSRRRRSPRRRSPRRRSPRRRSRRRRPATVDHRAVDLGRGVELAGLTRGRAADRGDGPEREQGVGGPHHSPICLAMMIFMISLVPA